MVHISGQCAFKDCDKPSVVEGFCAFHYNLVNQQNTTKAMLKMVELLGTMNTRLSNIEDTLQQSTPISLTTTPSKSQSIPSSSGFIPSITLPEDETNIQQTKTNQVRKDIRQIAEQLKNTGGCNNVVL